MYQNGSLGRQRPSRTLSPLEPATNQDVLPATRLEREVIAQPVSFGNFDEMKEQSHLPIIASKRRCTGKNGGNACSQFTAPVSI